MQFPDHRCLKYNKADFPRGDNLLDRFGTASSECCTPPGPRKTTLLASLNEAQGTKFLNLPLVDGRLKGVSVCVAAWPDCKDGLSLPRGLRSVLAFFAAAGTECAPSRFFG
jgi:hypothetical protein